MGVEGFMKSKPKKTESKEVDTVVSNGHITIDDKFLKKPLDPKDERVLKSMRYLERNNFNVDFKKIRRAFEGSQWRKDLKQAMDMKRFVQDSFNKNMMEQRWTLNLMRKRGKNPKTMMLIN